MTVLDCFLYNTTN